MVALDYYKKHGLQGHTHNTVEGGRGCGERVCARPKKAHGAGV